MGGKLFPCLNIKHVVDGTGAYGSKGGTKRTLQNLTVLVGDRENVVRALEDVNPSKDHKLFKTSGVVAAPTRETYSLHEELRASREELDKVKGDAAIVAQKQQTKLECQICFEDKTGGLSCGDDAHFVCQGCLEGYVRSGAEPEGLRLLADHGGLLQCPVPGCDCLYSEAALARHVSEDAFQDYLKARQTISEQRIQQGLERDFAQRLKDETARALAKSDQERRVQGAQQHIIEKILTLACPSCGQAFPEELDGDVGFSGCFALTCRRPACKRGFCAYCLKDSVKMRITMFVSADMGQV